VAKDRLGLAAKSGVVHIDQRRPHISTRAEQTDKPLPLRRSYPERDASRAKEHLLTKPHTYDTHRR
jgi:hypothetical protein